VYCDCGVMLCFGMLYRVLGALCLETVVCCCSSVCFTVSRICVF